jgi:hypothetical protein
VVETGDLAAVAADLPALCEPLHPIGQQWDRLSSRSCWMLMLRGPTKVDLIFPDQPHEHEPPWQPAPDNLPGIDLHFWDWALWLRSKETARKGELVNGELEKLFRHLLAPLGVRRTPESVAAAAAAYREARARAERRFGVQVPRDLENEVAPALDL